MDGQGEGQTADITLQRLCLPDPAVCSETDLYVHLQDGAVLLLNDGAIRFLPGGRATFDTWMNLLNLGVWARACTLGALMLVLRGTGLFHLRLWRQTAAQGKGETLFEDLMTLTPGGTVIDIGAVLPLGPRPEGLIMFRLTALGDGRLDGGAYVTPRPATLPARRLAICVTTFRREHEVAATAARVTRFLDGTGAPLMAAAGMAMHLFITDNGATGGQAVALPPHRHLTVIPNANLGGAGGFARGMAAAQDGGFTHCLFMDDDASFQMEALVRTAAFLALADSPRAALSGAMISTVRPWAMWEYGATFHRLCHPMHVGTDLRWPEPVARMELAAARAKPPGFYAGWWYFAFPLDQVTRYPFPFFVRGDDISFSLTHRFDTETLNGVVSFQEDFSAKESPLTLYLDLRNHLHQHLVHDGMDLGAFGSAKIVARFLGRSIVRMHYDSGQAQLAAWEDIMKGPDFFAANADMATRRPEISALARDESWRPTTPADMGVPALDVTGPEPKLTYGRAFKYLLNGHLVPFWRWFGRDVRIPVTHRGLIWTLWGLRSATFTNADESRAYRVTHSKRRAFGLLWQAFRLYLRWRRAYPALRDAHRAGYDRLANRAFWDGKFLRADPDGRG
jgi:galactofuranosylgalactofuranosylrhamnosyl-N-acetylglucosaminyl-diphospho-decaprenol beta-1,5/1,6-galactofuranosyltransferase